jgi:tRNA threonylcarbamoyladenosine biosynthesis protein TsaB
MRILAIETSTEHCSVALLHGEVMYRHSELAGQRHSEILLPMIDRLLAEAGCRLAELDGLAFGAGPGSFTGVRIAASVAQGLAFSTEIPVVPVCTLEALAEASGADKVACALDARLDEVYFAAYERYGHDWKAIIAPCLSPIGALEPLAGNGWTGVGSGFGILDRQLEKHLNISLADAGRVPQADVIARLGLRKLQQGGGLDAALAQPIYLRNKVAMTIAERHARGYK